MANELTEEIATYNASLSSWIDQEGKFVLIHKTEVGGFQSPAFGSDHQREDDPAASSKWTRIIGYRCQLFVCGLVRHKRTAA